VAAALHAHRSLWPGANQNVKTSSDEAMGMRPAPLK
jgi:hypothetical protein